MRKIFICIILILCMLCGCTQPLQQKPQDQDNSTSVYNSGVWLSFSEINAMLKSERGFKLEFTECISNCKELGIDNIYVHIRAFCDALYKSEFFPLNENLNGIDYDVLEYMIKICHENNIKIHAWLNPYRVKTKDDDITTLPTDSPAYKWLNDEDKENDTNVCVGGGVYLNPAAYDVRQLIIDGIREILNNYDVDGIHFDDYFYPTTEESFDKSSYEAYKQSCANPLPLDDWRRANVNALISGCYTAIKFKNKNIIFSISPAASIDKNYTQQYADVGAWIKSGCIDCIMPQLYFGFEYPDKKFQFDSLLNEWEKLSTNEDVSMVIGLASYKIGAETPNDSAEWNSKDDILAREIELCIQSEKVSGHVFFSYSSLFSGNDLNKRQKENILKINNKNTDLNNEIK